MSEACMEALRQPHVFDDRSFFGMPGGGIALTYIGKGRSLRNDGKGNLTLALISDLGKMADQWRGSMFCPPFLRLPFIFFFFFFKVLIGRAPVQHVPIIACI